MAARAGGWLHWTEARALACDVIYLENALSEHADMIGMIHFKQAPKRATKRRATAAQFKAFAATHNASFRRE